MTGLSKNSHISNVLKLLKLFKITELYHYMKFIFVKNLKNNQICNKIFEYLRTAKYKDSTQSFIKDFNNACIYIQKDENYVVNNINLVIKNFKINCREIENNEEIESIKHCLENNQDYRLITKFNYLTYVGRTTSI